MNITYSTTEDSAELEAVVADKVVVIVSPGRKKYLLGMVSEDRIQSFIYNLDEGAVRLLKTRLLELNLL